jgi:hypothetical protein
VTVREDVYNSEGWMKLIHVRQNLLDEVPSWRNLESSVNFSLSHNLKRTTVSHQGRIETCSDRVISEDIETHR